MEKIRLFFYIFLLLSGPTSSAILNFNDPSTSLSPTACKQSYVDYFNLKFAFLSE